MDPRLDVQGRIRELLASAPRPATAHAGEGRTNASVPSAHGPGRVRSAVGGALIQAGRALAGEGGTPAQTAARR
jgi:hypothetical protein